MELILCGKIIVYEYPQWVDEIRPAKIIARCSVLK